MGFVLLGLAAGVIPAAARARSCKWCRTASSPDCSSGGGRMVYDRTHTRELTLLEGLGAGAGAAVRGGDFHPGQRGVDGASGFSGFVAELQVLLGAWQAFPLAALAGAGRRAFGVLHPAGLAAGVPPASGAASFPPGSLEPITVPEKAGAVLLLGASLAIGLYPRWVLDWIDAGLGSTAFAGMRKVLGWP